MLSSSHQHLQRLDSLLFKLGSLYIFPSYFGYDYLLESFLGSELNRHLEI